MERAYRMMTGRAGSATGYLRREGMDGAFSARGLESGMEYDVYCVAPDGAIRSVCSIKSDNSGRAGTTLKRLDDRGIYCLAQKGKPVVVLCEECDNAQQCAWLVRQYIQEKLQPVKPAEEPPVVQEVVEEPLPDILPEEIICEIVVLETDPEPESIKTEPEITEEENPYTLRAPSPQPSVFSLPRLTWPDSVRDLQVYFDTLRPVAAFDAPGWRFVRVPMQGLPGVPYCALGMRAQDSRVMQIAYAVPGHKNAAPAMLPGYRYQQGLGGVGYWTLWRNV